MMFVCLGKNAINSRIVNSIIRNSKGQLPITDQNKNQKKKVQILV